MAARTARAARRRGGADLALPMAAAAGAAVVAAAVAALAGWIALPIAVAAGAGGAVLAPLATAVVLDRGSRAGWLVVLAVVAGEMALVALGWV